MLHKPVISLVRTVRHQSSHVHTFRESMSSIANQTMILTAPLCSDKQVPHDLRGATLSSVTSLSLDPKPLLQFNLRKPSTTSSLLHKHKTFAIHILRPNRYSVGLAQIFSKNRIFDAERNDFIPCSPFRDLELGKDYEFFKALDGNKEFQLPILKEVEKVFICKHVHNLDVQDHEIWIGEIIDIKNINGDDSKSGGLLNFNRKFHIVGDEL